VTASGLSLSQARSSWRASFEKTSSL